MSWWQKKLLRYGLRYGLSRTGLLDDQVLDLDNLNITIGSKNVIELKDVGLNIDRISTLAHLPPCLRLEVARIVLLRLTIPADFYQSSIIAEVDGVQLVVRLDEQDSSASAYPRASPSKSPMNTRSPQNRKSSAQQYSPPPNRHDATSDAEEDKHFPTTHEVAKSFLRDEPLSERKELEASVIASSTTTDMDESLMSDGSESSDVGTGIAIGLPGFLAGFLQGLVDRFTVRIRNIEISMETDIATDIPQRIPITIRLTVGNVQVEKLDRNQDGNGSASVPRRAVTLGNISLEFMTQPSLHAEPSEVSKATLTPDKKTSVQSDSLLKSRTSLPPQQIRPLRSPSVNQHYTATDDSATLTSQLASSPSSSTSIHSLAFSGDVEQSAQYSLDASVREAPLDIEAEASELDIQPGDDNISWGSRRSQSSAPAEDLWSSMTSEDDLPNSLLIEPERATTPRAYSSREESPVSTRSRRAVSPYDRSFHGPGSWPTIDDNSGQPQLQSPLTWPRPDQGYQSAIEPSTESSAFGRLQTTDNKKLAFEAPRTVAQSLDAQLRSRIAQPDDMSQSRIFSHEEAQSMYMSAMTSGSSPDIPGGWNTRVQESLSASRFSEKEVDNDILEDAKTFEASDAPTVSEPSESPETVSISEVSSVHEEFKQSFHGYDDNQTIEKPQSDIATPRAQTPQTESHVTNQPIDSEKVIRQLLSVDIITVFLTPQAADLDENDDPVSSNRASSIRPAEYIRSMPGTFSAYSESTSRKRLASSNVEEPRHGRNLRDEPVSPAQNSAIDIEIGQLLTNVDVPTLKLVHGASSKIWSSIQQDGAQVKTARTVEAAAETQQTAVSLSMKQMSLSLRRHVAADTYTPISLHQSPDQLICISFERVDFSSSSATDLKIGAFTISLCGTELLSVSSGMDSSTGSRILRKDTPSIAVHVVSDQVSVSGRPITEITLETAIVRLRLETPVVEEFFEAFGGISGILELGNSIASDGLSSSPGLGMKSTRGVRFAGDSSELPLSPELKLNARVGGLNATLYGSQSSMVLRSTTVKAVYREHGAVATVEHIHINGPYNQYDNYESPIAVEVATTRLEYLVTPQDKDLERLLSLLTPSKDKYENDDDILIDTLLSQRRKGSLLRLSVGVIKFNLEDWNCSSSMATLGEELAQLSAVAKYLPQDERPGLLTTCRVKEFECQLPVNDTFGFIRASVQDFHLAHVGLPALLALSVGSMLARRSDGTLILHDLLPLSGKDGLPMLMARILGDEAEPTLKIKLFNVCFQYSPSLLIAAMNMDDIANVEEIAASVVQTMAQLGVNDTVPQAIHSTLTKKTLTLDLLIHESAISLEPRDLSSRALLVMTDVHFAAQLPPVEVLLAKTDIRQASILLIDDIANTDGFLSAVPTEEGQIRFRHDKNRLVDFLSNQGFVSVVSIMSASVVVRIQEEESNDSNAVEIDIRNELLLLEACADSMQTLAATLSALAPPSAPSSQPKFLTEPMSIEDMMASFTGDTVEERAASPETLFDADDDTGSTEDLELPLGYSTILEDDDGLLADSEMTSSLYGPISALPELEDDQDDTESLGEKRDFAETAESLLEEDPFEMTITPDDMPLSDTALMRHLAKHSKPAVANEPVEIQPCDIKMLGFDAFESSQNVVGNQFHAASRAGRPSSENLKLPFRMRLRDCHVICSLYDGYDWQWTRDGIANAVEQVEQKAEERRARRQQSFNDREDDESVIGDFLFNSIYIGVPADIDAQDLRRQINRHIDDQVSETESVPVSAMTRPSTFTSTGLSPKQRPRKRLRLSRSKTHKIAFELKGVSADILSFPPGQGDVLSSVDLRLKDFEIFDNVPSSTWRKFLTHLNNDPAAREMSKPMFHIEILTVKTLESHSASELRLHVSVLPLRLHVDQDALDFITRFFEFKDDRTVTTSNGGEQPFLQRVEVETVDLCLDYKPKHVDYVGLRSGRTKEFMNFVTLDAANIRLKHAIVYGLRGFDALHDTLNDVWVPDVTRNQLPTVLAGLAPVRSLVNIGTGVRDVIAIPIREYQKDGRIVRSVQKGAYQFGKTTASELARLGAKVALGTQTVLSTAEEYLSPGRSPAARPSSARGTSSEQGWRDAASDDEDAQRRAVSAYANQPLGVLSGLRSARRYLEHDLLTARDALIAVQGEILESRGPSSAAAAVAKHAPTVILRPVIGATRAVGTTLLGVGNQIDRSNVRRVDDKYKHR